MKFSIFLKSRIEPTPENKHNVYKAKSIVIQSSDSTDQTPDLINTNIDQCRFLKLFTKHCLDAGYVLNIVSNLDKITDMQRVFNENGVSNKCFYTIFLDELFIELEKLHVDAEGNTIPMDEEKSIAKKPSTEIAMEKFPIDFLADDNPILYMVFQEAFEVTSQSLTEYDLALQSIRDFNAFSQFQR